MLIYLITNIVNNKQYVGQTKRTIDARWKSHVYEAKLNKYDMYFHKAIRKYGSENFRIELLETCDETTVYDRERYWIKTLGTLGSGYNQHEGGKGGCLNPTPALRKKLSDAKKNWVPWNKGLTAKTDTRVAKYGIAGRGPRGPMSEAHKQALRGPRPQSRGPRKSK